MPNISKLVGAALKRRAGRKEFQSLMSRPKGGGTAAAAAGRAADKSKSSPLSALRAGLDSYVGGGLLGTTGAALRLHPIGGALGLAAAGIPVARGIAGYVRDMAGGIEEEGERALAAQRFERMVAARDRHLQRMRMANLARVASQYPDVYNKVSAGMDLPEEATVIGGEPRADLLTLLADKMSDGGFNQEV